jgi:hypothetical protein
MKRPHATDGISRRDALKQMLLAGAGLALSSRVGLWASTSAPRARARSVIQIWMWGGPSQIDTFDPKPDAGYDYCGPLDKAIDTNVDGIRINAELPMLAQQADKLAIIRSMTHGINAHETASYMVQTGREPGRLVYPSAGAVVSLFKGYDGGYQGQVPPYIVLTQPQGRFSEAGFLGQRYKPFATGGDPSRDPFAVEGIVAQGVSDQRQHGRRDLLHALDTLGKSMPGDPRFEALDQTEEDAYGMMFGDARKLFDLTEEPDEVREQYGRNKFGQSCLAARRLVEQGVPYVTINYSGWDTHKQHFQIMRQKLPEMDRGMATLLQDLSDRGLLDTTIVWWSGEFGRTPQVQWEPPWNGGRGHYGACFSAVLAGGGFKGGRVVGASDEHAAQVVERPVAPRDLIGSVYTLLGIYPHGPLTNPGGIDTSVLPPAGGEGGGLLTEIM